MTATTNGNKAFVLEFAMYLEGIRTPFYGATVSCDPNGVTANVNFPAIDAAYNLQPKTSCVILYKDWVTQSEDKKPEWRVLFNGFTSSMYIVDMGKAGKQLTWICRDFRSDIRKIPAFLMCNDTELSNKDSADYNEDVIGMRRTVLNVNEFGNIGPATKTRNITANMTTWEEILSRIVGETVFGGKGKVALKGRDNRFPNSDIISKQNELVATAKDAGVVDMKCYLDAVIRGMWSESVKFTSLGETFDKRVRMDKRIFPIINHAGTSLWDEVNSKISLEQNLMGNSQYSSIEAVILNLAGCMFYKPYSSPAPSAVYLNNPNSRAYIADESVYDKCVVEGSGRYGQPIVLTETLLLPPLEFTAPPNCNLIFPSMLDRVEFQHDYDVDATRSLVSVADEIPLDGATGTDVSLFAKTYSIPTSVRNPEEIIGPNGFPKMILTLQEKLAGINMIQSTTASKIIMDDIASNFVNLEISNMIKSGVDGKNAYENYRKAKSAAKSTTGIVNTAKAMIEVTSATAEFVKLKAKIVTDLATSVANSKVSSRPVGYQAAIARHGMIQYMNSRYMGRVSNATMSFNPYLIAGFPGAIINKPDENLQGKKHDRTITGFVQQIQHFISIDASGNATASTSVVLSQARFVSEATDLDDSGNPRKVRETKMEKAKCNADGIYDDQSYTFRDSVSPISLVSDKEDAKKHDYKYDDKSEEYIYNKDMITLSQQDIDSGVTNRAYIDEYYDPNKINPFYKNVIGQNRNSFMIGSYVEDEKEQLFVYDSIHEAITKIDRVSGSTYEDNIRFIQREVCNVDELMLGVYDCSTLQMVPDGDSFKSVYKKLEVKKGEKKSDLKARMPGTYLDGQYFGEPVKEDDTKQVFSSILDAGFASSFVAERVSAVEEFNNQLSNGYDRIMGGRGNV